MSLNTGDPDGYYPHNHEECFYCGEQFHRGNARVQWCGTDAYLIEMHPDCALQMCIRLITDIHAAQCKGLASYHRGPTPHDVYRLVERKP